MTSPRAHRRRRRRLRRPRRARSRSSWARPSAGSTTTDAQTVLVPVPDGATPAADRDREARRRQAARRQRVRSRASSTQARGRRSSRSTRSSAPGRATPNGSRAGLRLRRLRGRLHPHELARDHDRRRGRRRRRPEKADTVYVEFRDGERVPAEIVGWDLFDDVGLLKVDPADHPPSAGAARRLDRRGRGRARGGDREPVRPGDLAERRRRLGDRALDALADLELQPRRRDPDGRADQPRQLGRADVRRRRRGDRDQRADPQRVGHGRGRRLRGPDQRGQALDGAADRDRRGALRLARRHHADGDAATGRAVRLGDARRCGPVGRRGEPRRPRPDFRAAARRPSSRAPVLRPAAT